MKQSFMRICGVVLTAALAACSGANQSLPTTSNAAWSQPTFKAPVVGGQPQVIDVRPDDRAFASGLVAGKPHLFAPVIGPHAITAPHPHVGYPLDMTCQTKACPVMNASVAYNVYVTPDGKTCKNEKCWGNPEEFLKGVSGSSFAGLITQYTKGAAGAYTYGGSIAVKYKLAYTNTFYFNDLLTILSAAAHHFKAIGLNAEYHLFLPPGIDTCFDQTNQCYSPDNLSSFVFCAYHDYVIFGKTPIIFSVEPWQNVQVKVNGKKQYACQLSHVPAGTNRLNSGTASTLGHESMESWSDPLPNTAWFNAIYGEEIGDVCAYLYMFKFKAGSNSWFVQQMYSNSAHGCNNS